MEKITSSTYYFIGRFSPMELCTKFNPREIHLGNGSVLDIFMDGVSIWIPGTKESFDVIRSQVAETLDTIVSTFNLITNLRLKFSLQSWVEAKGVISKSNLIGWFLPPGAKSIYPNPKSRLNAVWRRCGRSCLKIQNSFYHKLALRDYRNCIESYGDDSFFYAYRIIEGIRRAVTVNLQDGLDKSEYWKEMHRILGTSKGLIDPLTKIAEKVRHGALKSPVMVNARKNREQIINIAFDIMKKEFRRSFKKLF